MFNPQGSSGGLTASLVAPTDGVASGNNCCGIADFLLSSPTHHHRRGVGDAELDSRMHDCMAGLPTLPTGDARRYFLAMRNKSNDPFR
jgi:hypothetical protein